MSPPRRFVELFGVPIEVIDEARLMAETGGTGEHTYVVLRVADETHRPYPALVARRITVHCVDCGELCWFDPLSSPAPGCGTNVCTRCLPARLDGRSQT